MLNTWIWFNCGNLSKKQIAWILVIFQASSAVQEKTLGQFHCLLHWHLPWIPGSTCWKKSCFVAFFDFSRTGGPRILWFQNSWSPPFHDSVSGNILWIPLHFVILKIDIWFFWVYRYFVLICMHIVNVTKYVIKFHPHLCSFSTIHHKNSSIPSHSHILEYRAFNLLTLSDLGGVFFWRNEVCLIKFSFKWRSKYFIWKLRFSANFWRLNQCF